MGPRRAGPDAPAVGLMEFIDWAARLPDAGSQHQARAKKRPPDGGRNNWGGIVFIYEDELAAGSQGNVFSYGCVLCQFATNDFAQIAAQGMTASRRQHFQLLAFSGLHTDTDGYHPGAPQGRPASLRFVLRVHGVHSANRIARRLVRTGQLPVCPPISLTPCCAGTFSEAKRP